MHRRTFALTAPLLLLSRVATAMTVSRARERTSAPRPHPEPRPGITAARVLPVQAVHDPGSAEVFALVRQIPEVVDGIRCSCGCDELPGFYSLLSCFEESGMAQHCGICQGQAKLAFKLHQEGWSLRGIRRSIDAAYGA